MRENDGRKLPHATLEDIRIRAVRQHIEKGVPVKVLALALDFRKQTIYDWVKAYKEGGEEALRAKPIPGRPRKLSEEQEDRIFDLICSKTPDQLQFDFHLWTRWLVGDIIRRLYGISLSEQAVGRMLRRWGMTPQRPVRRATQRDEEAVMHWKTVEYPKIRAAARQVGATLYFGDEAAVRMDHHSGTTWAPIGETPMIKRFLAKDSVQMLSAVSTQGKLHFMLQQGGSVNSKVFIDFCKKLLKDDGGKVFLIVDGASYHSSAETREFVKATKGELRLVFLPPYAPDTNPDEWVWNNVKTANVGRRNLTSKSDLYSMVRNSLQRLQRDVSIVVGFFGDPHLAYIGW